MSSLREELTRTLLRLSRIGTPRPSSRTAALAGPDIDPDSVNHEGRTLGSYRILKRLGIGGMGHVYLAFDARLGRQVALKFLSPDLVSEPEMLDRLQSEARTASSLNHPNILTIYEIGEIDGEHFIASEFVGGGTLRLAIERKAIDVPTALDIVTQIASALVAAHSAGIIHRDLKPGNIMIRDDGYVKVIDFGLAKRLRRSPRARERDRTLTRPGTVVGTVDYMSPEQARGSSVDERSDIWSLGVMLYELVTRQLPFPGETETQVLDSIRDKPVPHLPPNLSLPPGLDEVIRRCLAKEPAGRYGNARELLAALGAVYRPAAHRTPRPLWLTRRRSPWRWLLPAAASLALAAALWHFIARDYLFRPDWFAIDKVRQLTFNGQVTLSCISPDGKYLAYVAGDPQGMQTLYLSQLNTATEQIKIPARKVTYYGLRFSPDNEIYAVSESADLLGKLYVVPMVGDPPDRPILVDIDGPVTFSPTGDRFAFVRFIHRKEAGRDITEHAIFVAARNGSNPVKIFSTTESSIVYQIAWSPKEDRIAAILKSYSAVRTGQNVLHLLTPRGEDSTRPLPDWQVIGQPWWTSDGRTLILAAASRTESTTRAPLRQIDTRTGQVFTVSRDLAGYKGVSLTRNDENLAVVKIESRANLWISGLADFSHGQSTVAEAVGSPTLSWTETGRILVDSQRGGSQNLWSLDPDTLARQSITQDGSVQQESVPIPNTHSLILASNRTGQFKLWRLDTDTSRYTQLTFGPNYDHAPTVSPDGRWIVYTSWNASTAHLQKLPVSGGESVQFGSYSAKDPHFSPDGQSIAAYVQSPDRASVVAAIPMDAPENYRPLPRVYLPFQWSPDGQALTSVITDRRGVSNIWSVPLDNSPPHQLTTFEEQRILKFAWSTQGNRLAVLRTMFGSDVALFTRSR